MKCNSGGLILPSLKSGPPSVGRILVIRIIRLSHAMTSESEVLERINPRISPNPASDPIKLRSNYELNAHCIIAFDMPNAVPRAKSKHFAFGGLDLAFEDSSPRLSSAAYGKLCFSGSATCPKNQQGEGTS